MYLDRSWLYRDTKFKAPAKTHHIPGLDAFGILSGPHEMLTISVIVSTDVSVWCVYLYDVCICASFANSKISWF